MTTTPQQVQGGDRNQNQLQSNFAKAMQPVLSNPIAFGNILTGVALDFSKTNVINHGLNRKLQGWLIIRNRDPGSKVYDVQDGNPNPQLTLLLVAESANITVDLYVF